MIAHRLDERVFVSGQIAPADMAEIRALGVTTIVNNRPDDEEPGQPSGDEIADAAEAAGLTYREVPVAGGIEGMQIEAMAEVMADAGGPMLLYCRSGTRSAFLWALAQRGSGLSGDEVVARGAAAGYDLSPIRGLLP
ncbi:MAG TPA: TIGR01244 family sulfur transferase [Allosphingosinicella sp.]|nr:TIGR01244 family sulfur transferase [Allosphingosinicella sp.]